MSALPQSIDKELSRRRVVIVYADRETTKLWNSQRKEGDTRCFGGWFWYATVDRVMMEGGPFRTPSAASRDAYYRVVMGMQPPAVRGLAEARAAIREQIEEARRLQAERAKTPPRKRTRHDAWRERVAAGGAR